MSKEWVEEVCWCGYYCSLRKKEGNLMNGRRLQDAGHGKQLRSKMPLKNEKNAKSTAVDGKGHDDEYATHTTAHIPGFSCTIIAAVAPSFSCNSVNESGFTHATAFAQKMSDASTCAGPIGCTRNGSRGGGGTSFGPSGSLRCLTLGATTT